MSLETEPIILEKIGPVTIFGKFSMSKSSALDWKREKEKKNGGYNKHGIINVRGSRQCIVFLKKILPLPEVYFNKCAKLKVQKAYMKIGCRRMHAINIA